MLSAKAPALVSVRYVLKVATSGAERELDGETICILIGADGLLLCSNNEMGGYVQLLTQMMNRGPMPAVVSTPKELRVLLGNDSKGLPAKVIARDSDRDLAWLRLDAVPAGLELQPIDLENHREAALGEPLYRLRRLDRFFGSVPIVESGVVGALADHPRKLLIAADLDGGYLECRSSAATASCSASRLCKCPAKKAARSTSATACPANRANSTTWSAA